VLLLSLAPNRPDITSAVDTASSNKETIVKKSLQSLLMWQLSWNALFVVYYVILRNCEPG
jgi:hypothetical protein